jgi:LNS2-like protein (lipin/Ned1/Smp2)
MRVLWVLPALLAGACADDQPPLTNATSLHCPNPGDLPFRLESHGFQVSANATLAMNDTRVKDEASDTLGNPNGLVASIYIADTASPAATPVSYRGTKARTNLTGGLFAQPLPGENVSLWTYDTQWHSIGRTTTDADGVYELPDTGFVAPNGTPVYAMLEANGDCMEHYNWLMPPGSKFVVTDIDGTMTLSDNEEFMQIGDESYTPVQMGAANTLMQTWGMKGYPIVYLTARPDVFRNETRNWLRDLGFPIGPLVTAATVEDAAIYKTLWLNRMIQSFGWVAVAAYGNADTDITAYENAGIPKSETFIVGPLAGQRGTTPIDNMDFTAHIASYVDAQPNN